MAKKNNGKDFLFSDDCGFINGDDEGGESYRYSDGSGYYRGADGSEGYIYSDGSGYYHGADGFILMAVHISVVLMERMLISTLMEVAIIVAVMAVMDTNIPMEVGILQIRREAEPHMMRMMTIRVIVV